MKGSSFMSLSIPPTFNDTSNEHNLDIKPATKPTTPMITSKQSLDKYWDKGEWKFIYLEGNEREIMLATIRSLGLRAISLYGTQTKYDIENFACLAGDIEKIAWRLSSNLSAAQLIQCAEDRTYLDEAIDTLFETHSSIWSLDADRTKLLVPGIDQHYPKDLIYEESEDQRLLWTHLHRWIFLMALRNRKQMGELGVKKIEKMPQLGDKEFHRHLSDEPQLDCVHTFEGPEGSLSAQNRSDELASKTTESMTEPISDATMLLDLGIGRHKIDIDGAFGQCSTKKSRQRDGDESSSLLTAEADLIPKWPPRRRQRCNYSSIEQSEQRDVLRLLKQRRTDQDRTSLKGINLGTLFTSYLENYNNSKFDEFTALKNIAHELSVLEDYTQTSHTKQAVEATTAFFTVSFPAWLLYRREIVDAKRKHAAMHASWESSQLHRHLVVLERSRLATQLRQAHEKFMNAGHKGLRPEQVIFQAMTLLMDGKGRTQTVQGIRNGFQGMEREVMTLGDQLMKGGGGAKWVMGDYPLVSSLDLSSDQEVD